jgi:hypothetical protein
MTHIEVISGMISQLLMDINLFSFSFPNILKNVVSGAEKPAQGRSSQEPSAATRE